MRPGPERRDVLWVATKAPWPAIDGGRRLLWDTLDALAAAGHRVRLVAPVDPRHFELAEVARELAGVCEPALVSASPRNPLAAWLGGLRSGRPWTAVRHDLAPVRRRVAAELAPGRFRVVVAEQLQAMAGSAPAEAAGVPVILRAQNVESDLWRASAQLGGLARPWLAREARGLTRYEGERVRRAVATVALTREDAARLAELAGTSESVSVVRAPFAAKLPPADAALPGEPAIVVLGSAGWRPNRAGVEWFVRAVWPAVRAELPRATLHLFGLGAGPVGEGIVGHPAPAASRDAFAPGALLAVPLLVASGVRMKILEAWARGLAVVATPDAARGLDAEDGRELLLARRPEDFAAAFCSLHREPERATSLAAAGRGRLLADHAFEKVAAQLGEVFDRVSLLQWK